MAPRWPTALPVAVVLLASTAAADYKESYKKGIEAVGRRDWPEVARLMKEAAAAQPAEGEGPDVPVSLGSLSQQLDENAKVSQ